MKKHKVIMIIEASIIIILAIILSTLYFNKNFLYSKTNNSIYDTFTEREIEQMRYSKLAWFSLTTDLTHQITQMYKLVMSLLFNISLPI